MSERIEAKEAPLAKIFSDDFVFVVPVYQRPFSWGTENFDVLFEDIKGALDNNLEQYFLGSIVLNQTEKITYDVVDGQQRLTALTILLAVIRDFVDNVKLAESISAWIYQAADPFKEIPAQMRVTPWEELKNFFSEYIYNKDGTKKYIQDVKSGVIKFRDDEDPRCHIFEAIVTFAAKILKADAENFVRFLLNRTYVVYIATGTQASAFRLFNVLNR